MPFVHVDFWPSGLVLAVALALVAGMRAAERYAHIATIKRTREALERLLQETEQE